MKSKKRQPPKLALKFLSMLLKDELLEEVLGDLHEQFHFRSDSSSVLGNKIRYWYEVINYIRPFAIKNLKSKHSNYSIMVSHFFKISWRNLFRHKGYSMINISGLAVGIAASLLIAFWVFDELSYDKYHKHYHEIAQLRQNIHFDQKVHTASTISRPLASIITDEYADHFKQTLLSSMSDKFTLTYENVNVLKRGRFMGPGVIEMLSLNMIATVSTDDSDENGILLSSSTAYSLFGQYEAIGKVIQLNNDHHLKVIGVYADLPSNTTFRNLQFVAPWSLYVSANDWVKEAATDWWNDSFELYVRLNQHLNIKDANEIVENIIMDRSGIADQPERSLFFHPMENWYLRAKYQNGQSIGGRIENVWLFEIIGILILSLACINFINLSTALSVHRGKEVGIRKSIGSFRSQIIAQFLSEAMLVVVLSSALAVIISAVVLPNTQLITGKYLEFPWSNMSFWFLFFGFILVTTLLAGLYPAFFLSGYDPIQSLKGFFKYSKSGLVPRKILVVFQFTFSVCLIIATILIFQQIQFTKDRKLGYETKGLIQIPTGNSIPASRYGVLKNEMIQSGVVSYMSTTRNPVTSISYYSSGFEWQGKPDQMQEKFALVDISHDFGKTVSWNMINGRDFSSSFSSDSSAILINATAAKYMELEDPVNTLITWDKTSTFKIIGVVDDMIMQSPYEAVSPTIYKLSNPEEHGFINIKLNPNTNENQAIEKIESIIKSGIPNIAFSYQYLEDEFDRKFQGEERLANLSGIFTGLAIFISCLGLFGLASFVADQRTKEIGIRKVLGASIISLWRMLSSEFAVTVIISFIIATPLAYHFMDNWLENYQYRISIQWWVFLLAGTIVLAITLITVSFQAIKAAMTNPIKCLRSE